MSNFSKNIFDYVEDKIASYKRPIKLNDSWEWNMREHILLTELYTNGQLKNGKDDWTPIKNIVLPILNLQHRAEDIDVKDVQLYINSGDNYHLSMLVKKYHDEVFVKENDIDTYFDELNVSRIDLGGGLSKKLFKPRPEVVPLQSIIFCNQKDLLSSPFGIEHEYSPDQLMDMVSKGWGNKDNGATHTVEELITIWRNQEKQEEGLKIIEVHGTLPAIYARPDAGEHEYETRIFIISLVQPKDSVETKGVILYTAIEDINKTFKLVKRDPIFGRALGRGGAEELFEPQVWTTYDMIRKQKMLDAAAVTILQSDDPAVRARHPKGLKGMKNLEIIDIAQGTNGVRQIDTFPRNMQLFDKSINDWEEHGKNTGGAQDPIAGKESVSGTPFAALQAQIHQGMGIHEYRIGQLAKHLEEIYYDWIIPHIEKEITKDFNFLAELSMEEMQFVADHMAINEWNKYFVQKVLNDGEFVENEQQQWIQNWKTQFKAKGNQHFIDVLKGEFKGTKLGVRVSIAGKSKDLADRVQKLTNVFRTIIANPYILQSPPIAALFNQIIEASGLEPIDLSNLNIPMMPNRRMTETIDYKDLPPEAQQGMIEQAGFPPPQQPLSANVAPNEPVPIGR